MIIIFLTAIFLLTGCSIDEQPVAIHSGSSAISSIQKEKKKGVPDDWEFVQCPRYANFLKNCNLSFPVPPNTGFEVQSDNAVMNFIEIDAKGNTGFFIQDGTYLLSHTWDQIANCNSFGHRPDYHCDINVRYIKEFSDYSIMAYENSQKDYVYIIKTNSAAFFVNAFASDQTIDYLDTSLLNIKILTFNS